MLGCCSEGLFKRSLHSPLGPHGVRLPAYRFLLSTLLFRAWRRISAAPGKNGKTLFVGSSARPPNRVCHAPCHRSRSPDRIQTVVGSTSSTRRAQRRRSRRRTPEDMLAGPWPRPRYSLRSPPPSPAAPTAKRLRWPRLYCALRDSPDDYCNLSPGLRVGRGGRGGAQSSGLFPMVIIFGVRVLRGDSSAVRAGTSLACARASAGASARASARIGGAENSLERKPLLIGRAVASHAGHFLRFLSRSQSGAN